MRLTPEDISEFKAIYKKNFGVDLTDDEANNKMAVLLVQMAIAATPLTANGIPITSSKPKSENVYGPEQSKPRAKSDS